MDYNHIFALGLVVKYGINATMTDLDTIARSVKENGFEATEKLLKIGFEIDHPEMNTKMPQENVEVHMPVDEVSFIVFNR